MDDGVLEGAKVRLEPLAHTHHDGLCAAIQDGELWNLQVTLVPYLHEVREFIEQAHADHAAGFGQAYATIDLASGQVAGSTRFLRQDLPNRRVEIGFTFLGRTWQRTAVNTEAKLLMLTHAFEDQGLNRVEFLTDFRNVASRAALARIGAVQEGVLRSHMVMRDGWVRDSVMFAITRKDWPGVKQHLITLLHPVGTDS